VFDFVEGIVLKRTQEENKNDPAHSRSIPLIRGSDWGIFLIRMWKILLLISLNICEI
jgi:hypothetical protein